jgi:hypothetical protein
MGEFVVLRQLLFEGAIEPDWLISTIRGSFPKPIQHKTQCQAGFVGSIRT